MKKIFIIIAFLLLNSCAIQAQNTVTLIPHLKNGDKIKMTTATDSLPYTATFEVVDATRNQINFNFHSDYRKKISKDSDVASLLMNLSHFGFATTRTGEFIKINNEQKVVNDYQVMMLDALKKIIESLNRQESKDNQSASEELSDLVTQIFDAQTVTQIAQLQVCILFPLANETLELGKSVSRKTTIAKTMTTPLSVYANMTYKLENIQEDRIKVVVEYTADSDSLINTIIQATMIGFKLMIPKEKDEKAEQNRQFFLSGMEQIMRTQEKDEKKIMNLKIEYFFDLKTGLPIESFSVLNMGGVIGTKIEPNVETKFKTTFELIR